MSDGCPHCDGGFIPYDELLAIIKRNFPNSFELHVKRRKADEQAQAKADAATPVDG